MIFEIEAQNTGPIENLSMKFGERLNLITGDNGLGKSFILDLVWFSLTRQWPQAVNKSLLSGEMIRPRDAYKEASITSEFKCVAGNAKPKIIFNKDADLWQFPQGQPPSGGMVFYAMADGCFAFWDPMRNRNAADVDRVTPAFVFNSKEIFDGLPGESGGWLCEGLIKDWVFWQASNYFKDDFEIFKNILNVLSSEDSKLVPGDPRPVSPADIRLIPTINMDYQVDVPIIHASSGVKRIVSLAYLLVWALYGHKRADKARGKEPDNRLTFLFDEVECHLHPKWQRKIIPALINVSKLLTKDLTKDASIQFIISTHSPLIMSSVEGEFDDQSDKWFDLDVIDNKISLNQREYSALGDADNWLMSEAFNLKTSYSIRAEKILNKAKNLIKNKNLSNNQIKEMNKELSSVLSDTDPFWINWNALTYKLNYD